MCAQASISVAIVDDDPGACAGMARLLRTIGMNVDTFASAEALLASSRLDAYDGLILDVRLGGMSGLELHRNLLKRELRIPVVYVTAHDDPQTRGDAERQGCVAFFGKTESGSRVIEALRSGASRYRAIGVPPGSPT
jgi:FixJ family two-component response regulator